MFASTQVSAATVARRHGVCAGRPVPGSMMWCCSTPPRSQRRTRVLDVAIAPLHRVTRSEMSSIGSLLSSLICTVQPPEGGVPATAMSPPRLTRTPPTPPRALRAAAAARSAARALAVAPRSSSTPAGAYTVRLCGVYRTLPHPGTGRTLTSTGPPSTGSSAKSTSYPAWRSAAPTVGSTSPSVSAAARSASLMARPRSGLIRCSRPALALSHGSSLSRRNRLQVTSMSRSTSSTADLAVLRASASRRVTTTRTRVPRALSSTAGRLPSISRSRSSAPTSQHTRRNRRR